MIYYILNMDITEKEHGELLVDRNGIHCNIHYNIEDALEQARTHIFYDILNLGYSDEDFDDIKEEFDEYFNYHIKITAISTDHTKEYVFNKELQRSIYEKYLETKDLFTTLLNFSNVTMELDYKMNIVGAKWELPKIMYLPFSELNQERYKFKVGDIVEYNGTTYIIQRISKPFNPEILMDGYQIFYNYGFDMIGFDKNNCLITRQVDDQIILSNVSLSDNNKMEPFLKTLIDTDISEIYEYENGIYDRIMKAYYYYLATGEIKFDL